MRDPAKAGCRYGAEDDDHEYETIHSSRCIQTFRDRGLDPSPDRRTLAAEGGDQAYKI